MLANRHILLFILVLILTAIVPAGEQRGRTAAADPAWARSAPANSLQTGSPTNVILFIADGMGPEHVKAGRYFLGRPLIFETFAYSSTMTTDSIDGVTDSAAAATAMATGVRVENGVISMALPGDGSELTTALETWQARGSRTGLVTTSNVTDASPAAFGAHEPTRDNEAQIADDYLTDTRPNVLLGGGEDGLTPAAALAAGYTVVSDLHEMLALDADAVTHVSGQFEDGPLPPINHGRPPLPSLAEMTTTALDVLEESPNGFFLMVEQEGTDSHSHGNDIELMVDALVELDEAVATALDWADSAEGETLIIVAADHETGGLTVLEDNGPGQLPDVSWEGSSHSDTPVHIFGRGPGAEQVEAVTDITELHSLLLVEEETVTAQPYSMHLPLLPH